MLPRNLWKKLRVRLLKKNLRQRQKVRGEKPVDGLAWAKVGLATTNPYLCINGESDQVSGSPTREIRLATCSQKQG